MNCLQKAGVCLAAAAAAVLLAYAGTAHYFSSHFVPGTVCDGVSLSGMDAQKAQAALAEKSSAQGTLLLIPSEGNPEALPFSAIGGVRLYALETLQTALRQQDSRGWLFGFGKEKTLTLSSAVTYDREKLLAAVDALPLMQPEAMRAPKPAYLAAGEAGAFILVQEDPGSTVKGDALLAAIEQALNRGAETLSLMDAGCYELPAVTAETPSLQRQLQALNTYKSWRIQLEFGAGVVEELPADTLFGFLKLPEAETGTVPDVQVDREAIYTYMEALAAHWDTVSESGRRLFNACDGRTVSIKSSYGWRLDVEQSAQALAAMIERCLSSSYAGTRTAEAAAEGLKELLADSVFAAGRTEAEAPSQAQALEPEKQPPLEAAQDAAESAALGTADAPAARPTIGPVLQLSWKQQARSHAPRDIGNTYAEVDLTGQMVHFIREGVCVFESPCVTGLLARGRATPDGIYQLTYKQPGKVLTGYNPDGSVSYRSPVSFWMPFNRGIGFHDATWRGRFGGSIYRTNGSHGCVNMPYQKAKELYGLVEKGMPVVCYF